MGGACVEGGGANAKVGRATGGLLWVKGAGTTWERKEGPRGNPPPPPPVPPDLTAAERLELESIRRRKQELLGEIQRLREELSEAMGEVEGLEASEGR